MTANTLGMTNFRNVEMANVDLSPNVNIILGDNAQGKTNLLEAMSVFALGKSFRASADRELIRFGSDWSELRLDFATDRRAGQDMRVRYVPGERKQQTVNGVTVAKQSDSLGIFRAVLFTPDHLELVKEAPELRRRFVDGAVCQLKPYFAGIVSSFNKVLGQRNALLKKASAGEKLSDTIDVWTQKLCELSVEIFRYRYWYIKHLAASAPIFYGGMTAGREDFFIKYTCIPAKNRLPETFSKPTGDICDGTIDFKSDALLKIYADHYNKHLPIDVKAGRTLSGPHRDDIHFFIDEQPVKLYGSQGQQRSVVLALKLAEGQVSYDLTNEHPLYLFDDILSELDKNRQEYILNQLNKRQMIVTSCNSEFFTGIEGANRIAVKDGTYT